MKTLIFAHRANIQWNAEFKVNKKPPWLIFQDGKIFEAREFSASGSFRTVTSFDKPLVLSPQDYKEIGDIKIWIEIEGEVLWS